MRAITAALPLLLMIAGCRASTSESAPPGSPAPIIYDLPAGAKADSELQKALESIDREIRASLDINENRRACGVVDVTGRKHAWINPDVMFYGASVPKICILLGYFEHFPDDLLLTPRIERELQLMIKRSNNELAAKYSQLIGLSTIQAMQKSQKYRFYDASHGGLWCGKHYGLDVERKGDPISDLSHSATVRQCLRFYLLLEQGRLGGDSQSRKIADIFAAPGLEFHDDNFVKGLRGRDVSIIRKNGLWKNWHLDTARIEHGDRVYLLTGIVHHAKGQAYLEELASRIDTALCGNKAPKLPVHIRTTHAPGSDAASRDAIRDDGTLVWYWHPLSESLSREAEYMSPIIHSDHPFNELLPSWNVDVPEGCGFSVEVRVGRRFHESWSPFLYIGDWGKVPPDVEKIVEFDGGKVAVDVFRSSQRFDRVQYRVHAYGGSGATRAREPSVVIRHVTLIFSDTTGRPHSVARPLPTSRPPGDSWVRRLAVPFRTQHAENPDISHRICSPTSLAMVLDYRGIQKATADVAAIALDRTHDIYGNWSRSVQAAHSLGAPGYLTRLSTWLEVESYIAEGTPLVVSVRVNQGELDGAPYDTTAGHLIVITGFDNTGRVLVNDPAGRSANCGVVSYARADLETVWLRRNGVAYVVLDKDAKVR